MPKTPLLNRWDPIGRVMLTNEEYIRKLEGMSTYMSMEELNLYRWRMIPISPTGTPDRHGDMIYECDILSIPERGEIFEVREGNCGMDGRAIGMFAPGATEGKRIDRMGQVTERIGNMFENPDLLKKYAKNN